MALAKDQSIRGAIPLAERVALEGEPYYTQVAFTGTVATGSLGGFLMPSRSRAFYAESLTLSSTKQIDAQVTLANGPSYTGVQQLYRPIVGPFAPVVIPLRTLFRPTHANAGNITLGDVNIRTVLDATPAGGQILAQLNGWSIYDDVNFTADKTILWVGDSITNGTAGITVKTASYEWRLREFYRAAGQNVRLINKSLSGTTSVQQEYIRSMGSFELPQVDLLCYSMGVNDASQSISAATHQANVAAMIAWKQARHPQAKMIVFGGTPLENNTSETALVAIRTAGQAAVTAAADAKVKFCNLGAAFDRTVATNYATTDAAGSRTHPNDAGHAAIYSTVVQPFLAANLPSI